VLVGLPGAGKTVCGELLAERLRRPFLDLDREIERMAGRTISEIFAQSGEGQFRDLETEATRSLPGLSPSVISPGGGWIEREVNRELVRGTSRLVYLRVSPATALRRLAGETAARPLLAERDAAAEIAAILDRRSPLYQAADAELDTEVLSPSAVVDQLVRLALRWGGPVG
jgi:shikimate kinase